MIRHFFSNNRTERITRSALTKSMYCREASASRQRIRIFSSSSRTTPTPPKIQPVIRSQSTSTATAAKSEGNTFFQKISSLELLRASPKIQQSLPIIGNVGYLALVSGFLMTDMLTLRVALVSGYTGLVAFHAFHPRPLKIPLRWSAVFVLVNAGAACLLAMDRWADLSPDEEQLYNAHFSGLTRGQFYQLMSMGNRVEVPDGTVLILEGEVSENVYFILKGRAKIYHHKQFAALIEEGGFVNDVAFQQGPNVGAYGTAISSGSALVIIWDQSTLRNHLESRPDMERNMKFCLSDHLVKSLLRQREAAHERQQQWNSDTAIPGNEKTPSIRSRDTMRIKRSVSEGSISW